MMIKSTRDASSVTRLLAKVYPFCEKMTQNSHQPKKCQNVNISKSYFLHKNFLKVNKAGQWLEEKEIRAVWPDVRQKITQFLEKSDQNSHETYTWVRFRIRLAHFPKYKNNYIH